MKKTVTVIENVFQKDGVDYPTLELRENGKKFGFTVGLIKAKLIVENIETIKAFVKKHSKAKAVA